MPTDILFRTPPSPETAGVQAVAVAGFLLALGFLIVDAVTADRLDVRIRWALAFPCVAGYSLLLVIAHVISGGEVFARAWLVRTVTVVVFAVLLVRRVYRRRRSAAESLGEQERRDRRADRITAGAFVAVLLLGLFVWGYPVFRMLPLDATVDTLKHMGWTNQLTNGEPLPSGPLVGSIPNYYPWLYHAFLALVTLFTPGSNAYHGLGPLQLMSVAGALTGFFGLGHVLWGRSTMGPAAAVLGAASGGFTFLLTQKSAAVISPRRTGLVERYLGDYLTRRSYNLSFSNAAPPFPRDISYAMFPAFLVLLVLGLRHPKARSLVPAGFCAGMTGLLGGEVFVVSLAVGCLAVIVVKRTRALKPLFALLTPAVSLWLLWAVPLILNARRSGGFEDLSADPLNLSAPLILLSWGVATPLALVGLFVARRKLSALGMLVLLLTCLVPLGAVAIPADAVALIGPGLQTLLRDHRYWPLVYGGVALFGAVGAAWLLEIMWAKLKTAAWVTASVLLLIAAASPIASSLELPRMQRGTRLLAPALSGERRATLSLLRGPLGEQRVVAVPPELQPHAFSFTGYRFIARDRIMPAIRWQGLALRLKRPAANRRLTTGLGSPRAWRRTARHFSVDVVVTTRPGSRARALRGCRLLPARAKEGYVVVPTSGCGRPLPES